MPKKKNVLSLTEARRRIFRLADEVQKPATYYTLTDKGQPKAVLMSVDEFESLIETIEVYRQFPNLDDDFSKAHEEYRKGDTVSLEELLKEEGLEVADGSGSGYVSRGNRKKRSKRAKKN